MAQPNYQALLRGYPGLASQLAAINAQGTANTANLTALRRRALIQYGQIPAQLSSVLTGGVNADIDQLTRDLAGQATQGGVSTVAQLQRAYQQANQGDLASLAARGLLRSGATGQHLNENLGEYQRQQYGAQQQLQDQLAQAYQGYLGQQQQQRQSVYDATQGALQGIVGQINAGLIGGGTSAAPPRRASAPGSFVTASQGLRAAGEQFKPIRVPKPASPSAGLSRALRYG